MKIKNISAKVIGILGKDVMPDATVDVNDSVIQNGSVAALIAMGLLEVDDKAEKEAALKEELRAELMAEMEAEKPKRKTRKKEEDSVEEAEGAEQVEE